MQCDKDRRGALKGLGAGLVAASLIAGRSAEAAVDPVLEPAAARNLRDLSAKLAGAPRRRDFARTPLPLPRNRSFFRSR